MSNYELFTLFFTAFPELILQTCTVALLTTHALSLELLDATQLHLTCPSTQHYHAANSPFLTRINLCMALFVYTGCAWII